MQYSTIRTKAHILNSPAINKLSHSNYYDEVLMKLADHVCNAEKSVDERIEEMQEAFLKIFDFIMAEEKISREEKIVLSLTENGCLELNNHSEKIKILALLEQTPQILKIMQRLAADALLKKGIQNIKYARKLEKKEKNDSEKVIYQASMKGALSHFYLI